MCIVFFYVSSQAKKNQYRLVIASNRDEYLGRKSMKADYWSENNKIIGGRDLESTSRGSWLAFNFDGKIGALLNIHHHEKNDSAESRGVLVANFLKDNISPLEYNEKLKNFQNLYNGYHLLLFDTMSHNINVTLQTNVPNNPLEILQLSDGIYGLSNSPINLPYKKVDFGKQKFENIIKLYNDTSQKDFLIDEILKLLKSEEKFYPDDVLMKSTRKLFPDEYIEKFSSVFVKIPEKFYGTRTHTIILLNSDNYLEYNEFSMEEPINIEKPIWSHQNFLINLQK